MPRPSITHHANNDHLNLTTPPPTIPRPPKNVAFAAFAPHGGYFLKFQDNTWKAANLPPSLQNKLNSRSARLPPVSFVAISKEEIWFIRYQDGSSCWSSGVNDYSTKLWKALQGVDMYDDDEPDDDYDPSDEEVSYVVFAPGGGWFIQYQNGECCWERLPKSLVAKLEKKGIVDTDVNYRKAMERNKKRQTWKNHNKEGIRQR